MSARRITTLALLTALVLALAACSSDAQPKALATLIARSTTPPAAAGKTRTPTLRAGATAPRTATIPANATVRTAVSPTPVSGAAAPSAARPAGSPTTRPATVRTISIDSPATGDAFLSGATVKGKVSVTPGEKNLSYRVYNGKGQKIGSGAVPVSGEMGQPGAFDAKVQFSAYKGPGWIEIIDQNAATGAAFAAAAVDVYLGESKSPSTRPGAQVLAPRKIIIDAPKDGAIVGNPFEVQGSFTVAPFENNLTYYVYDAKGDLIGSGFFTGKTPDVGKAGTFAGPVSYQDGAKGAGRLEVLDKSAADGFVLARGAVNIVMGAGATATDRQATMKGVVTYVEKVALSPSAVIDVQLQDVSRADAPAVVISDESIRAMGRQVPIPFELTYDPSTIKPNFTYVVRATITEGGKLTWTTTTAIRVLTGGNPLTNIEVVVQKVK